MKLVFDLDGVICTPPKGIQYGVVTWVDKCKPIANAIEFMQYIDNLPYSSIDAYRYLYW